MKRSVRWKHTLILFGGVFHGSGTIRPIQHVTS
jgi:hypothetical protein